MAAMGTYNRVHSALLAESWQLERQRQINSLLASATEAMNAVSASLVPSDALFTGDGPDTTSPLLDDFDGIVSEQVHTWLSSLGGPARGSTSSTVDRAVSVSLFQITGAGYAPGFARDKVTNRIAEIESSVIGNTSVIGRLAEAAAETNRDFARCAGELRATYALRERAERLMGRIAQGLCEAQHDPSVGNADPFWDSLVTSEDHAFEHLSEHWQRGQRRKAMDNSRRQQQLKSILELMDAERDRQRLRIECRAKFNNGV